MLNVQGVLSQAVAGVVKVFENGVLVKSISMDGTATTWSADLSILTAGSHALTAQFVPLTGPAASPSSSLSFTKVLNAQAEVAALKYVSTVLANADALDFTQVGQQLNLSQVPAASLEKINLMATNQVLSLSANDLLSNSVNVFSSDNGFMGLSVDGRKQMLIDGVSGSKVNVLDSSGWASAGTVTDSVSLQTYAVYNYGTSVQLLIDSDLTRQGAVL